MMNPFNILLRILANAYVLWLSFAVIIPTTLSAKDDILFGFGLFYGVFLLPCLLWYMNADFVYKVIERIYDEFNPQAPEKKKDEPPKKEDAPQI